MMKSRKTKRENMLLIIKKVDPRRKTYDSTDHRSENTKFSDCKRDNVANIKELLWKQWWRTSISTLEKILLKDKLKKSC